MRVTLLSVTSVTDKFRKVLNIGDCVKALTDGKSYTNIGIVERFSRDCSRVFFVDFRKLKQNRAPANLLIVDLDNDNEFGVGDLGVFGRDKFC